VPRHTLYWQQSQSHLIESWEFQFQRVGSDGWEWVYRVEPVDNCAECFQAVVELPATALLVRSRAIGEQGASAWSKHLPIYLPEPGFTNALLIGVIWFALLRWATKRLG
jgi:hypothetical protein